MAQLPDALQAMSPEARAVYDRIAAHRGPIRGPYAPLMHHPPLADVVAALGEYLRFRSTLPGDVRELAILITARAAGQPYEWVMHEPVARQAGLPPDIIERVRARGDLRSLPARYADAAQVVEHVLAFEALPQELADRVTRAFGRPGLLELVVLPGFYRLIAGVLFAFEAPLPERARAPF